MDISDKFEKITARIDQNRLVSASEQVTITAMGSIEALGVDPIYVSHASGQVRLRSSPLLPLFITLYHA